MFYLSDRLEAKGTELIKDSTRRLHEFHSIFIYFELVGRFFETTTYALAKLKI